ncbi:MarR family winged helix-turn-helix transcriptional regulator [Sphingobacterium sp. SGR-19]|uniref:MarR family winged helix-turn-helix transcriptional regulator n=1 Tax=Sphingobacterium sp. SGR-19 TaxID=2710886 RepID=UPI0013EE1548|nr:MarR family winged helix-turn-helix transcriptional regulator [Sphingobacterium sp. SGR-19]NGM66889.1 winged helix-turn-helix transcriptional regulator [Sphingobacterium sp. SGR-19]
MNYNLIKDVLDLVAEFENKNAGSNKSAVTIDDFKKWIIINYNAENLTAEPNWEGKESGRSPESVINTLIVHMNRYAKSYSKSAIFRSDFSSQEDFIYLINLKAFGEMTKMDLIKKNVHEKPVGMQIINRLISKGWVNQAASEIDKRSKVLKITDKGIQVLDKQMGKIRKATKIVTGDLTKNEKMELIRLLDKLNNFHKPIYDKNIQPEFLLEKALNNTNL